MRERVSMVPIWWERQEFLDYIARDPEAGDLIPGTSGIRKVGWRRHGMGKRGGTRLIYFYHNPATPLFLLMVYAKTVREGFLKIGAIRAEKWVGD